MLTTFQRYHRPLSLGLLGLFGLAAGVLAATLLGAGLRSPAAPSRSAAPATLQPPPVAETELGIVMQHHLFNPAARSTSPVSFSLRATADGAQEATVRTDLELLGTIVAGSRSLAVIRMGGEVKTYRLEGDIPGGRIEQVRRNEVTIRNHDRSLTVLRLLEAATAGGSTSGSAASVSPSRSAMAASRAAPGGQATAGPAGDAVRSAGSNRWVVARSTANAARDNLGEQLRLVLMQPNLVDGKTDGFAIRRIQPSSLLAQMGLQRDDIVKRVNGMPLDSPEKGLQIMQQLREARQITVDLVRAGKPLSFSYEIE